MAMAPDNLTIEPGDQSPQIMMDPGMMPPQEYVMGSGRMQPP